MAYTFQNSLVIDTQAVEDTLSLFNKEWQACVFVWDPKDPNSAIITKRLTISNEELRTAFLHALENDQINP